MNDFVELRKVIQVVLRRWWLLVLAATVTAAIGYGVSQRQERVYAANTSIIVGQSIQSTQLDTRDIQTSERLALTYADIVRRQPVLEATIRRLELGISWQSLRRRVSVSLVENTQLVEITVEASSREEAIAIANELTRQLVLLSPASVYNSGDEESAVFVKQRLQDIQLKIETNQARIADLSAALDRTQTPETKAEIQEEINNLEKLIVSWEDNYTGFLQFAGDKEVVNYVTVVDQAYARATPLRPNIRLNTIIAGAVGLFLGLGTVLVLDFLDDTIKTVDELGVEMQLTPLGSIGRIRGRDIVNKMIVSKNPFLPVSESYRIIRDTVLSMLVDRPGKSIMVTSPAPGDGKSVTAVNLAIAMAHSGRRTIIVDADLRRPVLHDVFDVPNGKGLTNMLYWPGSSVTVHLRKTTVERLYLLTAGDIPPNPSELLGSERMEQLMSRLMANADVVIFDSPPAALVADATVLAKRVDGVVLVVAAGETQRDVIKKASSILRRAGANILGVVLNKSNESSNNYYYKYAASSSRQRLRDSRIVAALKYAWNTMTLASWRKRKRLLVEGVSRDGDDEQAKYPAEDLQQDGDLLLDLLSTETEAPPDHVAEQDQVTQQGERISGAALADREETVSQKMNAPQNGSVLEKDSASNCSETRTGALPELQPHTETMAQVPADGHEELIYLGSEKGSTFHKPDCRHMERIDAAYHLSFTSREMAVDLGYSPCKVCKP